MRFDTTFPGGNALDLVRLADDHYSFAVDLRGGERGLWFCFRTFGAAGRTLTFDLRNGSQLLGWPDFGGMRPVYGFPGDWRRVERETELLAEAGMIRFSVPCPDGGYVAFCYPYTLQDLNSFWQQHLSRLPVRREVLARSPGGHPLYVWQAGAGRQGVWITCRNHAGESPASYVLEGLMLALAEPEGTRLLDLATLRACPVVDVDNVASGGYGKYGPPCDPYMEWREQSQHPMVAALQHYYAAVPESPRMYVDLHSPEPCGSTFACTWTASQAPPDYVREVERLCQRIHDRSLDPLKLDLSCTRGYPEWFGDDIDRSSQGYFRRRYGCLALTLEVSYHWASAGDYPGPDDYRAFGRALCQAICEVLAG